MSDDAAGSRESKLEIQESQHEFVRAWMDALDISSKEEADWRKRADETVKVYRSHSDAGRSKDRTFNILHSNIQTTVPAVYNSTPVPDVRRRYQDADPVGKQVADILERCLSYSVDNYDFDNTILAAVQDNELVGRGVSRVRYVPYLTDDDSAKVYEEANCEHVQWKSFRRGPGRTWSDVPWVAFELFLTREELVKLSPEFGNVINLDSNADGTQEKSDGSNLKEVFKRAKVWEIWDKESREVVFIAESKKDGPIRREKDPLQLTNFFPIPRPLVSIDTSDSLVPIIPYDIYRDQAEELERVSSRIMALVDALKARGAYDGRLVELGRLADADDNELVAIDNVMAYADNGGLEKAISWFPLETISKVLEKLYLQRDQIKQAIYEITGIADILRGQTNPNETLGAQEIKQQWGSLRIQRKQAEVQRYARDLFRLKAEIFSSKFEWQSIVMMTGLDFPPEQQKLMAQQQVAMLQQQRQPLPPELEQLLSKPSREEVERLLRDDAARGFRIDVESDSTIRADMTRNQSMMAQFLDGTAKYMQSIGPMVVQGSFPKDAAVEIYTAFARNFRLGKQAEDALDRLADSAKQESKNPPGPDPKLQAEQSKIQGEQQLMAAEMQFKQQEHGLKLQEKQIDMQIKQQELELKREEMELRRQEMQLKMALQREQMELDREAAVQRFQIDTAAAERDAQMRERAIGLQAESAEHKYGLSLGMMDAKASRAAKRKPTTK